MAIERVLKRVFNALPWLLIAVAAYFQACGATQLLSMALLGHADRKHALDPRTRRPPPEQATKSAQAILDRNPFDSVTGPLPHSPMNTNAVANVDPSNPLSWPACEGVQVLMVTESSDPRWSLATLRAPGEPSPRLRRVGDGIAGKQVAFIGYNPKHQAPSVWLESSGALCQSVMFQHAPKALAPTPALVSESALAPIRVTLPAAEIPQYQASILSQVRVVPELKGGKILGLRLFGIRSGSLLGSLGLRNGDRLESINGFEIASPEKALQAYAQLRTTSHLRALLTRGGKPLEIVLNIR